MKKKLVVLLSTTLLAASITGCTSSQATTPVTDDLTIASYTQGSLKSAELNKKLISTAGMQAMLDFVDKGILDAVQPATDEMIQKVDQNLEQMKAYYKDDFETSLKINGFDSEDAIKSSLLLNEQRNAYILTHIIKNELNAEEIQTYYDEFSPEIRASHILIKPSDESETAKKVALLQAQNLIKRINNGEDFAELAKEFSADPGSSEKGGDLGSFGKGMMVKSFEDVAFALKVDQVTVEPVESQFGYHIIKKTGGEEKKSFEEMKATIEKTLAEQKLQSDQSLSYKALIKLREDNNFKIENTEILTQYELFINQVNK